MSRARRPGVFDLVDVRPQLPTEANVPPTGPGWVHDIKYDGYRGQISIVGPEIRILTRNGVDWTSRFPALVKAARDLAVSDAVLDGEVTVERDTGRDSFGALQEALSQGRADELAFRAFDLLRLDGVDFRDRPLGERKGRLKALLEQAPKERARIRYADHLEDAGDAVLRHACRMGLQGIVSKRIDSPYRAGLSRTWLKTKCSLRDDFVIGGFTAKRGHVLAVLVGAPEADGLHFVGKVGSGLTENLSRRLHDELSAAEQSRNPFAEQVAGARFTEPRLVAEVEYRGWTANGLLWQAVFRGLRDDKSAADVDAMPALARAAGERVEAPALRLTYPERILWPEEGITKEAFAAYLAEVAPLMLPHVVARPLTYVRCPDGIANPCFFQKHPMPGLTDKILELRIPTASRPAMVIHDEVGLAALAQIAAIEVHINGARVLAPAKPDRLVFDLDPDDDLPWGEVVDASLLVRDRLANLGLVSFLQSTGGKGLHVVVPVEPATELEAAKAFTRHVAEGLAAAHPKRLTANLTKHARRGRVFIDYLRNSRGATAIAPYSARARPGAMIALPMDWAEILAGKPLRLSITGALRRVAAIGNPWPTYFSTHQHLPNEPLGK